MSEDHNQAEPTECDARDDGFYCTRPAEHSGRHVALDFNDEVVHNWAQEASS